MGYVLSPLMVIMVTVPTCSQEGPSSCQIPRPCSPTPWTGTMVVCSPCSSSPQLEWWHGPSSPSTLLSWLTSSCTLSWKPCEPSLLSWPSCCSSCPPSFCSTSWNSLSSPPPSPYTLLGINGTGPTHHWDGMTGSTYLVLASSWVGTLLCSVTLPSSSPCTLDSSSWALSSTHSSSWSGTVTLTQRSLPYF